MPWTLNLFLLIIFGFSVLTHAFFWYEYVNGDRESRLNTLSRGRLAWWMCRGILQGFGVILLVFLLFPFGFVRSLRFPRSTVESTRPPVILVHGLYHNASGWLLYRSWLKRSGFHNIYGFSYSSFGVSFDELLKDFEGFVRQVEARHPGHPLVMIGHSLGGLICRAFADSPGNAGRVMAVVTLGSPHRGSKLAALSLGRLGQSLLYGGRLFKDLEKNGPPAGSHRLAIYSPMDTMVLPADGLRISDPHWRQLETSPVSHISMLFHRPTSRKVIELLREAVDSCS
jgi:triacylglycerol lipase